MGNSAGQTEHWKVSKEQGWDPEKQAVVPLAIDVIGDDSEPQMFVCDMATPRQIRLATAAPQLLEALKENIGVKGACEVCWRKSLGDRGVNAGECNKCQKARALITHIEGTSGGGRGDGR